MGIDDFTDIFLKLSCFSNVISRWPKQYNSKRENCFKLYYLFQAELNFIPWLTSCCMEVNTL